MAQIRLTQGFYALVDEDMYGWLNRWKWYVHKSHNTYYAYRGKMVNGKLISIAMHRQVLGLTYKDGKWTDHRNHNGLDNRRCNIRICSRFQNSLNQTANKNTSSKYKGVSWAKKANKWYAHIKFNQKSHHIGSFTNEIDAAKAYNVKALELFGEFAYLNAF